MTLLPALTRLALLGSLASALTGTALLAGPVSQAAEVTGPTATVGAVTCVEEDGSVEVTLASGDAPTSFLVFLDGSADEELALAAGETRIVSFAGLSDGDHTFEIDTVAADDGSEGQVLAEAARTVACDAAPEGPYTNARGSVLNSCGSVVEVQASNRPIGGNTADLQPVTFTLSYVPMEQPQFEEPDVEEPGVDDPGFEEPGFEEPGVEEPADGAAPRLADSEPVVLDTFTLDAANPTFQKSYSAPENGPFFGTVVLTADGTELANEPAACVVPVLEVGGPGGGGTTSAAGGTAALPNTGA